MINDLCYTNRIKQKEKKKGLIKETVSVIYGTL